MRKLNIIFLEGVRKIGKSSQCVQLRLAMQPLTFVHQINLDRPLDPKELMDQIDKIREWCKENPEGTLIVNGSLAYSIVSKDLEKQKYGSSYVDYELPIKNFLNLLREFKIAHILLKSNNYEFLKSRYSEDENYNPVEVSMLYNGFEFFEQGEVSGFKWQRVEISQYDTILQIHAKILKQLE